jgi:hypothetical protein
MDATNDLVLGVFANYSFEWLEAYLVSLSRCGFKGRKVFMVWNIAAEVRAKLIEFGFELVDVPPANMSVKFCHNFFEYRDKLAFEYLRDHSGEFRFVFWMDIRDLVFQTDPSVWMEQNLGDKKIVVASECILIKDETINDGWLKNVYDAETYHRIRPHEVLNGGTFAGTQDAIRDVFERIYNVAKNTSEIAEQAALNVILRDDEFKNDVIVPRMADGFAAVGYGFGNKLQHIWKDECPDIRQGILYPKGDQTPFCIVHQYDRNKDWRHQIASRYTVDSRQLARKNRYAADGLTQSWYDQ